MILSSVRPCLGETWADNIFIILYFIFKNILCGIEFVIKVYKNHLRERLKIEVEIENMNLTV